MLLVRLATALILFISIEVGLSTQSSVEASPIGPITFTVNLSGDAGDGICDETCTLRDAVTAANNNPADDTIVFDQGLTTITLSNEIVLTGDGTSGTLTINGPGANLLTIDGGPGTNRIFSISGFVTVTGLTLTGGNGTGATGSGSGGAIYVTAEGVATLDGVNITGNSATQGGGIYSDGENGGGFVNINNSTLAGNTSADGGGIYTKASSAFTSLVTVANSTISANTASNRGGAIFNTGGTGSQVAFRNSTLAGNEATNGGKCVYLNNGTVSVKNTILSCNTTIQISLGTLGSATSEGYNLSKNSLGAATAAGDITNTDPLLGPLQNNGGPTPTHALLSDSPAIDAGDPNFFSPPDYDQRGPGFPRVVNGRIDIGAYEFSLTTAAVVTVSGRVMKINGKGINGATVTITDMFGNTRTTRTNSKGNYRFDGVEVRHTYLVQAKTKKEEFAPQVVMPIGDLTDINFIAP